jgi:hypothetical protein
MVHALRSDQVFENSPPAPLESRRSQRNFSFNFLLRGQKVKKTMTFAQKRSLQFAFHFAKALFLHLRRIAFYVCRCSHPASARHLNGKHKINNLCALCGSAVKNIVMNTAL